jgi:hypothetical protein
MKGGFGMDFLLTYVDFDDKRTFKWFESEEEMVAFAAGHKLIGRIIESVEVIESRKIVIEN